MIATKSYIKKDDKVKVITGKDKGKIGKVLKIHHKKHRVLIENINMTKRHTRPSAKNRQGGIVEAEAPIELSNVLLMCGKCLAASRIKSQRLEDGKKIRVCGKCGESLDS